MNRNNITKVLILSGCLLSSFQSYANQNNFSIGPKIGLPGIGIEARVAIPGYEKKLYARFGANYFGIRDSNFLMDGDLKYKVNVSLLSVPLMLDYHPFNDSGFRVSAGVAYINNSIKAKFTPGQPITLYGTTFSPQEIGAVNTRLKLGNSFGPVFSLGYDRSLLNSERMSLSGEVGLLYLGKPKLSLGATGLAAVYGGPALKKLHDKTNDQLRKARKYLEFMPIFNIGLKINL
jgi:hypothetical protein